MEEYLREIVQLSLGSTPEEMLRKALETCIELSGASGGSILGEEGPYLQFLFSDLSDLIGVRVPLDSIAGISVNRSMVVYTYAPKDQRRYAGVDEQIKRTTKYLLSIPIPSVHRAVGADRQAKNAGALQLLFDENIFPEINVEKEPKEFKIDALRENELYEKHLKNIFWMLPIVAFGMEVIKLRQTSYQAIHELKNKLIAGLSWIDYLKEDIRQRAEELLSDENISNDFELSESSIREGAELAKTYLQLTRIYAPNFEPVNINDVLRETAASVRAFAAELNAVDFEIALDLDPNIGPRELDAGQLKMAFFNLCKNAVEVLVEHKVTAPVVRISSVWTEGRIEILISDNGSGMPPEIADNLFVPFRTKKEGGTGLGLTITKKIVDVHGGTIKCETGKEGTRFTIII